MRLRNLLATFLVSFLLCGVLSAKTMSAHDRFLGKADAPVVIYEFSSLLCSHCATFNQENFPLLKKDYIDKGLVKFVFLDAPFGGQVNVFAHSLLYKTKNNKDFFALADALFANQQKWATATNPTNELKTYAKLMGISDADIKDAETNTKLHEKLKKNSTIYMEKLSVEGTPTIFITKKGQKLMASSPKFAGNPTYSALKREIDIALSK